LYGSYEYKGGQQKGQRGQVVVREWGKNGDGQAFAN